MLLGEALNERARLAKRVSEVRDILPSCLIVQEGEDAPGNPETLMAEAQEKIDEIERLVARINKTNSETRVGDRTLTETIAYRDALGAKVSMLEFIINTLARNDPYSFRRSASELRQVRQVNLDDVVRSRDNFASERRRVDAELQAANWTTELL